MIYNVVSTAGVDWGLSLHLTWSKSHPVHRTELQQCEPPKLRQRDADRLAGFSEISHVTAWTSVGHLWTMMAIKPGDLIYQMSECRHGNDALLLRKLEFEVV